MDELKPCPFCGSKEVRADKDGMWWTVGCTDCFAEGPSDLGESGAIAAWNERQPDTAATDLLAACKMLLSATDPDTEEQPYLYQRLYHGKGCRYCGRSANTAAEIEHNETCPVAVFVAAIAKAEGTA